MLFITELATIIHNERYAAGVRGGWRVGVMLHNSGDYIISKLGKAQAEADVSVSFISHFVI